MRKATEFEKLMRMMDSKELTVGGRIHWAEDLAKICYQQVEGSGAQAQLSPLDILEIDGFFHMAGIVSSGKTTLSLHAIAEAQKKGGICAFIDAEHALDPEYTKKIGVRIIPHSASETAKIRAKQLAGK